MEESKISIILPTYNSDDVLENAIKSVIEQTYKNWELVIIENGKKGQAEQIAQSFNDKRIIYMYQEQPNVSNARNVGLENVTGKYVAFIDSDDRYEKDFLQKMVQYLEQNNLQLVTCGYRKLSDKSKMLIKDNTSIFKTTNIKEYLEITKENYLYNELRSNKISTILDDRDVRLGVKFNDMDLIGIPIRITIGNKINEGLVDVKERKEEQSVEVSLYDALNKIEDIIDGE